MEKLTILLLLYSFVVKCLWSTSRWSRSPLSFIFWKTTPILPTMLLRSATTWSPAESIIYPPDAATSLAKVYNLRLCFCAKSWSFSPIIWLCTGSPPGELTTTARATARDVLTFLSRFINCSVLSSLFSTFERGWDRWCSPLELWLLSMSLPTC